MHHALKDGRIEGGRAEHKVVIVDALQAVYLAETGLPETVGHRRYLRGLVDSWCRGGSPYEFPSTPQATLAMEHLATRWVGLINVPVDPILLLVNAAKDPKQAADLMLSVYPMLRDLLHGQDDRSIAIRKLAQACPSYF